METGAVETGDGSGLGISAEQHADTQQHVGAELATLAPAAPVWTNSVPRSNRLQTTASAVFMVAIYLSSEIALNQSCLSLGLIGPAHISGGMGRRFWL